MESKINGCSSDMFTSLKTSGISIGAKVNIIFGDPCSANGLKKLSRRGVKLPNFMRDRTDKNNFAIYEFPDGKKVILDEFNVCERK